MELGYLLYFLVVFVGGGTVLIGLAAYFAWETVTRRQRTPWPKRTRRARAVVVLLLFLFVALFSIPLRILWVTRVDAIPGAYATEGVWGAATLTMKPDGTFVEVWQFKNDFTSKSEGQGVSQGTWRNEGRDWLTRDITLTSFKGLAEYDRDHTPGNRGANVMGYGGVTSMEVDAGSEIVFRK